MGVQGAWADEVSFIERSWDASEKKVVDTQRTITAFEKLEGSHSGDWKGLGEKGSKNDFYYVVNGDVSYKTLVVFGRVHLILADNSKLTCSGGIKLETQNEGQLFVYSQSSGDNEGKLVVTNSYKNAAGIGSSEVQDCGPITIHGGVIEATGAQYGAGIGTGASAGDDDTVVDPIVVYGGRVTAHGGEGGAGIGAGSSYSAVYDVISSGGKFTIYGGTVTAVGGENAAGLGGGGGYHAILKNAHLAGGNGGEVYVYGGQLTAEGGSEGAGIGGGNRGKGGKIFVYDGVVTANGGYEGAGFGGGYGGEGAEVHISGGIVDALGGFDAAGIGSGSGNVNLAQKPAGSVEVTGGKVTAIGSASGAGIGGGYNQRGADVTITGGIVFAFAQGTNARYSNGGCAIGKGATYFEFSRDKDELSGTLKLGDNYMVTAGDDERHLEHVSDAASRVASCRWRSYARIEECPHISQGGDAANVVNTYTVIDDVYHQKHCLYCYAFMKEIHNLDEACVCGFKGEVAVDTWKMNIFYATNDGKAYAEAKTNKVIKGKEYMLPRPTAVEGLIFMGYLKADKAPESIEMKDSEIYSLAAPGTVITPQADSTYYARYRYDYTDEWTWDENYTSATVTVTWANGDPKLENLKATVYSELINTTTGNEGFETHTATYAYEKAEGITYNFTRNEYFEYIDSLDLASDSWNLFRILNLYEHKVKTLTLSGRTFYRDGYWNTLCLPFDVKNMAGTPLEGATVMEMDIDKCDLSDDGVLTLAFKEVPFVEADHCYIVKWPKDKDIVNPVFKNVTLKSFCIAMNYLNRKDFYNPSFYFVGNYDPTNLYPDGQSIFLGKENSLGYTKAPRMLGCFHAYLVVPYQKGQQAVRSIKCYLDGEEATGIFNVPVKTTVADGAYYDLQGRKIEGKPTRTGLYIQNGRKVVIK